MELQALCCSHLLPNLSLRSSYLKKISKSRALNPQFSSPKVSATCFSRYKISGSYTGLRNQRTQLGQSLKWYTFNDSPKRRNETFYLPHSDVGSTASSSGSDQDAILKPPEKTNTSVTADKGVFNLREPFRGKSGSVSFCGLTHQVVEEGKLESSPFKEGTGSFIWVLAPVALISSLLLPQFFLGNAIYTIIKDEILADMVISFSSEALFYIGIAAFLLVTDHVQRPYLQFSPKRWGLITGLRGYLSSAFFIMGFKLFVPLLTAYVVWPVIGLPALVAVAPFLVGCGAQLAFEAQLERRRSSCWPLVPIIFEVYRLYQLTKAANFVERLMLSMKGSAMSPELLDTSGALVLMLVVFQVLGVICLWSLTTFLLRLFPSRPVAEKY
ncbi:tRNA-processing ribonuclease BN [Tasmannia lanceolata]|uniref:tRNA-processing ribonuclease BN n=1 Tax=Tasmannia lanceolata TaxID=3420 RepID=UPI004063B976